MIKASTGHGAVKIYSYHLIPVKDKNFQILKLKNIIYMVMFGRLLYYCHLLNFYIGKIGRNKENLEEN